MDLSGTPPPASKKRNDLFCQIREEELELNWESRYGENTYLELGRRPELAGEKERNPCCADEGHGCGGPPRNAMLSRSCL
jgi:hypothetical protein